MRPDPLRGAGALSRRLLAALSLALLASPGAADDAVDPGVAYDEDASLPAHAEDVVDYTLTASLDPVAHTIHGEGTIRWKNTSSVPAKEMWFHLYLNAFKNEKSVFMREPVGGFRGGEPVKDWGWIDVRSLEWDDGEQKADLWKGVELRRLDDEDETDARVTLPREIAPGESIMLTMVWDDKLPSVVERTGYDGSFHMVGQWFPKVARLEPDGRWAHFPFHHLAEFYADFGTYDVTLRAPKGTVLGATGPVVDWHEEGGQVVERHVQQDVHDFAWTAWDQFQKREETIAGVKVTILYPPHFGGDAERELKTMRFGIPYFGKQYGKYPYDVLTLVHPPVSANEAGGMEYPTLITTGGPWYGPPGVLGIELVTIHEFGHQYFYGMLASNELAWPFLDEGINSYAEEESLRAWRGEGSLLDYPGFKISDTALGMVGGNDLADATRVAQPASAFATGHEYGGLVYARTATILETLRRVYGPEMMSRAMGRYARRARFQHPVPEDLLASLEEVLGPIASENARAALFDKATVDYEVTSLQGSGRESAAGVFDMNGKRETLSRKPVAGSYDGWVLVTRKGRLAFPVDVEMTAEDGTVTRTTWSAEDESVRLPYSGGSPLAYAVVDPDRKVLLDMDSTNNAGKTARAPGGSSARTFERVMYWSGVALQGIVP